MTPRLLETERAGGFFTWFALKPNGAPEPAEAGHVWQEFRPSSPNYSRLVALAVLTDETGRIIDARLGVDRGFLEHQQESASARDIAKSFLYWALPEQDHADVATLLANIADLTAGGAAVIMRGSRTPPPPDTRGGYAVFLGQDAKITLRAGTLRLVLTNFAGALPAGGIHRDGAVTSQSSPRWLRLDVRDLG